MATAKLNKNDIIASWDSGVFGVGDVGYFRVQVRGTGFGGSISVLQGESETAVTETKNSGALVAYTGSSEYYDLRPSSVGQIVITLGAGTINEVLVAKGSLR